MIILLLPIIIVDENSRAATAAAVVDDVLCVCFHCSLTAACGFRKSVEPSHNGVPIPS